MTPAPPFLSTVFIWLDVCTTCLEGNYMLDLKTNVIFIWKYSVLFCVRVKMDVAFKGFSVC